MQDRPDTTFPCFFFSHSYVFPLGKRTLQGQYLRCWHIDNIRFDRKHNVTASTESGSLNILLSFLKIRQKVDGSLSTTRVINCKDPKHSTVACCTRVLGDWHCSKYLSWLVVWIVFPAATTVEGFTHGQFWPTNNAARKMLFVGVLSTLWIIFSPPPSSTTSLSSVSYYIPQPINCSHLTFSCYLSPWTRS